MIKHIVMWRLKEVAHGNTAGENALLMKQRLEALRGRISGMISIEVGLDFSRTEGSSDIVLYTEFIDRRALEGYQDHPEHMVLAPFIVGACSERRVVDYE